MVLPKLFRIRILRELSMVAFGNVLSAGLRFILTLFLANYFSVAEWGYFLLFWSVLDIAAIVADFGLKSATVRLLALPGVNRMRVARKAAEVKAWSGVLVFVGTLLFWGVFMRVQDIPEEYGAAYVLAVIGGVGLSVTTFGLGILQGLQYFPSYALFSAAANAIRVIGFPLLWLFTDLSFLEIAAFIFLAPVAAAVAVCAYGARALRKASDTEGHQETSQRKLLAFMLPIGMLGIIVIVLQRVDLWILQAFAGPEQVGNYGIAFQVAFLFPLLASAVFNTLLPKVSGMTQYEDLRRYRKNIFKVYPYILGATVLGVMAAPALLWLVFGERFAAAIPLVAVLVLMNGVNIIFNPLGLIFYAVNRPIWVTWIQGLQVPALIVLDLVLIPWQGALGAAIAALLVRLLGLAIMIQWTGRIVGRTGAVAN